MLFKECSRVSETNLWTFGTPPHRRSSRSGCREGLHGAQMSAVKHLMPLNTQTDNYDRAFIKIIMRRSLLKGYREVTAVSRYCSRSATIRDLRLHFPPTETRTSVSISAHWQSEKDCVSVCTYVCEPVIWPPWDPVSLQQVIYSNSVQHVVCQMGIKLASVCVFKSRLVLVRLSCVW